MLNSKKRTYFCLLILVSLGLTIYSNTLGNKFVWDDDFLIVKNHFIKNWHYLPKIFTSELRVFSYEISNYYRPLQSIFYAVDYLIWRLDSFGYHLSNILLHVAVSFLILLLINLISKNYHIALLTSILFLVHPIHTEVNSYISGRADSLAALFLLGAFILYIKHGLTSIGKINSNLYFIFSIFLFILALLSKETVLVYPFILFFYDCVIKKERKLSVYLKQSIFFIISLLYILLRLTKLNFLAPHGLTIFPVSSSFFYRFVTSAKIVFLYLKLLLLPLNLYLMRSMPAITHLFTLDALLSLSFLLALCTGLFLTYKFSKIIFFYYIWFLIFLLPTLNLFPIGVSVAEHFVYLPSIGFFAIISTFLINFMSSRYLFLSQAKKIFFLIFISFILFYLAFLTYRQNEVWKNNLSLYTHILKYVPDNYVIHNNLGSEYLKYSAYDKAETEFQKTLQINPNYAYAYNNLGNLYLLKDLPDKAIIFYKKAVDLRPGLVEPHDNLGKAYLNLGKYQEAISEFNLALRVNPRYTPSYQNLGVASYNLGNKQMAIDYYKKAIEIDREYIPAYYNLGFIFYNDGDFSKAYECWHKALEISPDDIFIKSALGRLTNNNSIKNR